MLFPLIYLDGERHWRGSYTQHGETSAGGKWTPKMDYEYICFVMPSTELWEKILL